ncbi:MAG: tRNA pseudouridine(55) synthase TruB [Candidatus Omnitrophica bacterium]|nr:tRNA pseudouridine(55) synthase TruB [Candidatus Omnitrophota bacterium]
MNGILIVDKPMGWTSHDVCHFIRKKFSIAKVGHAGILDKNATGVLVVLLGHFTKLSSRFLNETKEYTGTMELGSRTTTHDAAGEIVETLPWQHVRDEDVIRVMEGFKGEREQLPPMASAVKLGGVRLYKLARQGKEIDRPHKTIHVYELVIQSLKLPVIEFYCKVSKGTYVRTLAHDIGHELGTGAHLKELRRTASGVFRIENSVTVDQLKAMREVDAIKPHLVALPVRGNDDALRARRPE